MKQVFLKYNNMYVARISTCEDYVENEFISRVELSCNKDYADTYYSDKILFLIQKLSIIGFDEDLFYTEEKEVNKSK